MGVAHRVGEAVAAVEICRRRIGKRAIGVDRDTAMARIAALGVGDAIAIGIGCRRQIAAETLILVGAEAVMASGGRLVGRHLKGQRVGANGSVHTAIGRAAIVLHAEGERGRTGRGAHWGAVNQLAGVDVGDRDRGRRSNHRSIQQQLPRAGHIDDDSGQLVGRAVLGVVKAKVCR